MRTAPRIWLPERWSEPFLEGRISIGATRPAGVTKSHLPGPQNASFAGVAPVFPRPPNVLQYWHSAAPAAADDPSAST